jgi:hypothetical protein
LAGYYSAGLYGVTNSVKNVTQAFSMIAKGAVKIEVSIWTIGIAFNDKLADIPNCRRSLSRRGGKKIRHSELTFDDRAMKTGIFILKLRT